MADEKIVTSIVANSDFSNLIADVQRVTGSLSKLQQEFAGANRALAGQINATNAMFSETMRKTGQFSTHFVSLTSDVEKFGRNLDSGRLKLRDYFRVYQEHTRTSGGLIRDLAKQQVQLQNAVLQPLGRNAQGLMQYNVHIPRGLDLTKNKTSLLKQELQIMNKVIQDGGVQLINWGKNTQWAGRQLTVGLTLPLAAFGKAAADAFKVADQELTRLTKVYGDVAGTSAQELSKIREEVSVTAKELSAAMGVNFSETIALAADIAATGKTGNELLSSISETTRLAVLGEVDRQEAMKATLAIQTAFKQNTEELADSINFLNAVENQTSTTLNDLVTAIPKAGPVIKSLGGSIQDLALYLTAMREGGINASEGANALKSGLASLINPTKQTVGVMKDFGIDILGMVKANAGDTTALLFDLQRALDQLDPLSKAQAIEQMFGKFQFARISALLNNLGKEGSQTLQVLDLIGASAAELEAVAGRELAAVTESAAGRFRRAVEGLKAELAGVGEDFLNIGTKLINVISKIIDFGQKLPDPIKKILAFGGAFTAILGPVIMLTGVLANFFGYIIKGLGHFKALFKGAEGFKLLTPEIMAARAASEQLSNEFYSDAKAADTLRLAIEKLNEDLMLLQQNALGARTATESLGKTMTTSAGTPIMTMGGTRVVNPAHPLLGGESRASAHLNPRNPGSPSTIFGLTMQPIPVNRRLGANPQILMEERLPDVPGLTTVSGVSTGVVAGEHARYAALMATLGVQSRQEIEALKKTIGLGGQVSRELIDTFDDILPITQRLTRNAAAQSAQIVAELKAGTINVEQARAQIIAVNAELERLMGAEVTQYAMSRGRTIDLTKAPLINQPVVDAAGKPNLRGMYRQGIFSDVMSAVGRATRTRTFGGPYSIETTRPSGLIIPGRNMGGPIFYNNGDQVPGPNVNADVVPAMLTPGEFVIRRDVAQSDPEGMRALNNGEAVIVPVQRNIGGVIPLLRALQTRRRSISGLRVAGERSGRQAYSPGGLNFESMSRSARRGGTLLPNLQQQGYLTQDELSSLSGMIGAHGISRGFLRNVGSRTSQGSYPTSQFKDIFNRFTLSGSFTPTGRSRRDALRYVQEGRIAQVLPGSVVHISGDLNTKIAAGTATRADFATLQMHQMTSLLDFLSSRGVPSNLARRITQTAAERLRNSLPSRGINEQVWAKTIEKAEQSAIIQHSNELASYASPFAANRGGMVPGYSRGGYARGVQRRMLGGGILRMLAPLGIMFGGQQLGSRVGGGAGTAISTASSFLPFMMYPGMFAGMRGPKPTIQQKLGAPTLPQFTQGPTLEEALAGAPLGQMIPGTETISGSKQSIFAPSTGRGLGRLSIGGGRFAGGIANMAEGPNKFVAVAGRALAGLTRLNVALGVGVGAVALAMKKWKDYNETQRLSAAAFGLTAESAEKAGLKFTDYNTKIKDAIAAQKLMIDQNMMTYESLQSAGTPFKMTIEEYKKLRKELKETMAEQVKVINATSRPDAARVAVQLKEQLMAAGLSAEEAAKRIYTLFNLSNKAGMAVSVINTDAFKQIVDAQTAAASALQSFNYAKNFENTRDAAAALNTALTAINTGVDDLVAQSEKAAKKKGQDFDETAAMYEAEKKQLDVIASKIKSQESIGQDVLNNLKKQNPEIEKFVNSQDTAVSVFQKLRLVARGFTGDLAEMNAQQAEAIYKLQIATSQAVQTTNREKLLKRQYKDYDALKAQIKDLEKAAKGQSVKEQIDAKERIKALDKEIKKINEKAEAKKKALQQEAQAEDMALRIQQKKLEYEKFVAAGDFGGAATAKIDLQRLQNEQQLVLTEQQIEQRRLKDIAPLEREKERLQNAQDALANKAALAAESLESMRKRLGKQKEAIDAVNEAMTNLHVALEVNKDDLENFKQSEEFKGLAGSLVAAVRGTGQVVASSTLPDVKQGRLAEDVGQMGLDLLSRYGSDLTTIIAQKGIRVTATGDIVIDGKKVNMIEGKRDIAAPSSAQLQGIARAGSQAALVFDTKSGQWTFTTPSNVTSKTITYDDWLKGKKKYAGGGLLSGPGTGTSDSILGMYANGGMVRVSNGEYVVNADTVSKLGVPFFDRINGMKNGGLMLNYDIPKYGNGGMMTMPYKPSIGGTVQVGSVTMQFAEAPANGKQLFEEFKAAMAFEQRTINPNINMNRRY